MIDLAKIETMEQAERAMKEWAQSEGGQWNAFTVTPPVQFAHSTPRWWRVTLESPMGMESFSVTRGDFPEAVRVLLAAVRAAPEPAGEGK